MGMSIYYVEEKGKQKQMIRKKEASSRISAELVIRVPPPQWLS
jgi:hypothetical protein